MDGKPRDMNPKPGEVDGAERAEKDIIVDTSAADTSTVNSEVKAPNLLVSEPFALVNSSGCCVSCEDASAQQTSLKCLFCKSCFHATCKTARCHKKDVICTKSFYDSFDTATNSDRPGNFVFVCDICMRQHEQSVALAGETSVNIFDDSSSSDDLESYEDFKNIFSAFKDDLKKELSDMYTCFDNKLKDTVSQLTDNSRSSVNKSSNSIASPSFAQVTENDFPKSSNSIASPSFAQVTENDFPKSPKQSSPTLQISHSPPIIPQSEFEVLILSPNKDSVPNTETINVMGKVKKAVEKKLENVQVEFVRPNSKSLKIAVGFRDTTLRENGEKLLNADDDLLSLGYKSKPANKMLPKISLFNVSSDIFDDIDRSGSDEKIMQAAEKKVVIDSIIAKNPCVAELHVDHDHTLEVVFINKNKHDEYNVILKLSPAIRIAILNKQNGTVYLGLGRYRFSDRYHVQQCYHCQAIGHTSKNCPVLTNPPVCLYCMGKHRAKNCPSEIKDDRSRHRCARCLASTYGKDAESALTHNSASPNCPVIIREMNRLQSNTDFTSLNRM
jgi:hypothetical protein